MARRVRDLEKAKNVLIGAAKETLSEDQKKPLKFDSPIRDEASKGGLKKKGS